MQLKSILRRSAATVLLVLAVLFLVISGPLRGAWGFVGNASNASSTVIALMKDPTVQRQVANKIETTLQDSSSPAVAQQIAAYHQVVTGAVVTLFNNPLVQQLVSKEVGVAYTAVTSNTKASLDFTPIAAQVTAALHTAAPGIPIQIDLGQKLVLTIKKGSYNFSGLGRLGSGSVLLWLLGLVCTLFAALVLFRTRLSRLLAVGASFGLATLVLLVLSKAVGSIAKSGTSNNELATSVAKRLSAQFGNSLVHSALLDLLTGVVLAAAIVGFHEWQARKKTPKVEAAA
jgi:hypothetical protein